MDKQTQPINWYPGHMAKTRRLLADKIKKIDLVIELCDARLPHSSRNPEIDRLAAGKARIVLLNKADLADPGTTALWLREIRKNGQNAYAIESTRMKQKEIITLIQKATSETVEKSLARGIRKTVKVIILGVPNVGKSTFINQLRGKAVAQTEDRPGVTRSSQWVQITPYLELLDTPGLLWPRLDDQKAARRLCYIGAVKDEITDQYMLAVSLLEDLAESSPAAVKERFHLDSAELRGTELSDAVCKGRGWLLKGNQYDYERAARVVLDEFRDGKLGRISLEKPRISDAEDDS